MEGRCEVEQEEALVSGGRRGMEDEVARGRAGGTGWRRWGCEGGQRGVERAGGRTTGGRVGGRDAQGQTSGAGSVGWARGGAPSSGCRLDH
jgi:hypothetical protein